MPRIFITLLLLTTCTITFAQEKFDLMDIFELELASDPQISPNGEEVIYVRNFKDVMKDANRSNLWKLDVSSGHHEPVTTGMFSDRSPRWSPDQRKLAFVSNRSGSNQIHLRYLETGAEAQLTHVQKSPGSLSWSPDGQWLAFSMAVSYDPGQKIKLPKKPEGAKWAPPPVYIDELKYKSDGVGFLKPQFFQVFLLSVEGGTPRQLTSGPYNHGGSLSWTPDGKSIYLSSNRHANREYEPRNSEVYRLDITSGDIEQVTERLGPDNSPKVSPDGQWIAYTGFDDNYQGYQVTKLYLRNVKDGKTKCITESLDRDAGNVQWTDANNLCFQYDDYGDTKVAQIDINGKMQQVCDRVGGMSLGRPYSGGTYTVSKNGTVAYTLAKSDRPSDVAIAQPNKKPRQLTDLNMDLFNHKELGTVEEVRWKSSFDGREVQGWICKPPDFDPGEKYPLMLEIHGGPFTNYGDRFSAEIQLYASSGYVVLFTNPRGSTSYGQEFGNLIHHNYPGEDYDDLMSGVDAVIDQGYVDPERLFVTGGSGGGVLTSWIIGKTDRFKAAVVAKPVINWYSFVLHADNPAFFYRYWFPGLPWENERHYMKRSPISLVGNVTTPTMLLTGEEDHRTPMSETEQYYAALQLNKVESAMVRIPGASHGIANKPSQLMAKVASIVQWFEKYDKPKT